MKQETKMADVVAQIIKEAADDAIQEAKKRIGAYSAVEWSYKPFVSASTRSEAQVDCDFGHDDLGVYVSLFDDDDDARFIPVTRIIECETGDTVEAMLAIIEKWHRIYLQIKAGIEAEIDAATTTAPESGVNKEWLREVSSVIKSLDPETA